MATATKKAPAKKAAAKSAPKTAAARMDAITLLTSDHREVKAIFKRYDKLIESNGSDEAKKELAESICTLLTVHATIEEAIFYPAAREALKEQDLVDEAEVEHASAKELIAQIQSMEPSEDLYDAKMTVLGEYIDHHVKEEESEMFSKVKKSGVDTLEIGKELAARKDELLSEDAGA